VGRRHPLPVPEWGRFPTCPPAPNAIPSPTPGVHYYTVTRRTKEIGIRMALGAKPIEVIRLVLGSSSRAVLIGFLLGFAGAAAVSQLLRSLLFGLSPFDPLSYVLVALLLAAGLAATFLPARRATKIDPMAALRCE
jgi:putative ABC transport system permease protein